jgi:hypothetical protein
MAIVVHRSIHAVSLFVVIVRIRLYSLSFNHRLFSSIVMARIRSVVVVRSFLGYFSSMANHCSSLRIDLSRRLEYMLVVDDIHRQSSDSHIVSCLRSIEIFFTTKFNLYQTNSFVNDALFAR